MMSARILVVFDQDRNESVLYLTIARGVKRLSVMESAFCHVIEFPEERFREVMERFSQKKTIGPIAKVVLDSFPDPECGYCGAQSTLPAGFNVRSFDWMAEINAT